MNMVFVNPQRCIACHQCEVACLVEHSQSKELYNTLSENPQPRRFIKTTMGINLNSSFPGKCSHCNPAPCQSVCPTSAIQCDDDLGIVFIEGSKCILCRMCAMVCPFDVISFFSSAKIKSDRLVAIKCDNCIERQQQGLLPACVDACKAGALQFGNLNKLVGNVRAQAAQSMSIFAGQDSSKGNSIPTSIQNWRDWCERVSEINER